MNYIYEFYVIYGLGIIFTRYMKTKQQMKAISKYAVILVLCYITFSYLGCKKDTVHIDYRRPSKGDTTTLRGTSGTERGDSALNSVFLDLSKEIQTTAARNSWDFGFYCGKDAFKVIINHSTGATVTEIAGKSLADVNQSDSITNAGIMTLTETAGTAATVDAVTGDSTAYLAGTVIALNKVYILNRGNTRPGQSVVGQVYPSPSPFKPGIKFMVTQITNGYHIAYGNLIDQAFGQIDVLKDASFNFKYISLSSLTVTVEPAKPLWDIEFTRTTYKGTRDPKVPVVIQPDFVMINFVGNVRAAEIISPTKDGVGDYDKFTKDNLSGIVYSGQRDVIGVNWFDVVNSSTAGYSVRTDRFYVIKDPLGNVYKMNFFGGGGRGRPIIRYNILVDNEPIDTGVAK